MTPARPLLLGLVLGALLAALAAPAGATAPGHPVRAAAPAPTHRSAVVTFVKNYRDTSRSRLVWRVRETRDGRRTTVESRSWRAGSGFRRHATDACRRNDGWLPNGRYRPVLHDDYRGRLIRGRAIYLGSKACHDGTVRTALFIHTEQGAGNRQCLDRRGDQVCRWEYPRIDDYRSHGCIKLSPRDLRDLVARWHAYDRGRGAPVTVTVH